ncbi:MAG: hypothetical protein JNL82_09640 [Myxococcales bacterium]|nr:hypothetical protein [Myxococcales bacterium]
MRRAVETTIEGIVGTRVWTPEFEAKHLALGVEAALAKAHERLRQEAFRTRRDGRHVGLDTVLIGDDGVYFALKEEVLRMRHVAPDRVVLLQTVFPLCLHRTALDERWSHSVRMQVTFDADGLIHHLVGVVELGWREAAALQTRAAPIQRMQQLQRVREVDSREYACGAVVTATRSVASCLAVVLHDAAARRGCLGHIDTDCVGDDTERRYALLAAALATMRATLASEAFTVSAFGGTGWFEPAKLHALVPWFPSTPTGTLSVTEAVVYDPTAELAPVRVVAPDELSWTARATNYNAYEDTDDAFYLFRVAFGPETLDLAVHIALDA